MTRKILLFLIIYFVLFVSRDFFLRLGSNLSDEDAQTRVETFSCLSYLLMSHNQQNVCKQDVVYLQLNSRHFPGAVIVRFTFTV